MNPPRFPRRAALAAILLLLASTGSADSEEAVGAQELAQEAVRLAAARDAVGLAERLHYPPDDSAQARQEDAAGVAESLRFLFEHFGEPKNAHLHRGPFALYEIGAGGGTLDYWRNLRRTPRQLVHAVEFSRAGPGFLKIVLFRTSSDAPWEIQAVTFALPESPAAKAQVIALMKGLSEEKGIELPPDYEALLDQQLQPTRSGRPGPDGQPSP